MEPKGGIRGEQVALYRRAIEPVQHHFASAKAARLQIIAGGKGRSSSSEPTPLLPGSLK